MATQTILEHGYQSTSMDWVARRAEVSKATLYSYFGSKEILFRAIIDHLATDLSSTLDSFDFADLPLEEALHRAGRLYLDLALSPSSLNLHRIIVAEAGRHPALGRLIYRNGPLRAVSALASYLDKQEVLDLRDPKLAAEQFFGMVLGHTQLCVLLGARRVGHARIDRQRIVHEAVRRFLGGAPPAPISHRRP